jgi:hypothetical protein
VQLLVVVLQTPVDAHGGLQSSAEQVRLSVPIFQPGKHWQPPEVKLKNPK